MKVDMHNAGHNAGVKQTRQGYIECNLVPLSVFNYVYLHVEKIIFTFEYFCSSPKICT